ncbi:MAG TPA: hypothetical protein VF642_12060 [Propionibacteriaceae bacterium]|jgi:hypothetical protein
MISDETPDQTPDKAERSLDRRLLLRGGAVLAGAAGVSVIGAAMGSTKAEAADGQFMVVGQPNSCESTTAITLGAGTGGVPATLTLTNVSGPALRLARTNSDYDGGLKPGEIASTAEGLELGVGTDSLPQTTWLATGLDLDEIPFTFPVGPTRVLDTRISGGREAIQTTSADAFDSSFRLKAGAWMDVAIAPSDVAGLDAVFANITAVQPVKTGFITAYPPGDRPGVSTLNFTAGQTIANGAFSSISVASEEPDWIVLRIYSSSVTHVVLDMTGVTLRGISGAQGSNLGSASQRKAAKADRMDRVFTG